MANCAGCNKVGCGCLNPLHPAGYGLTVQYTTEPVKPEPKSVQYRTLSPRFLALMDEIGRYGFDKYGDESAEAKFARGDFSRSDRTKSREIAKHAANHFEEYIDGIKHDKFNTREHQLAAAAFNAMMEFQFFTEGR